MNDRRSCKYDGSPCFKCKRPIDTSEPVYYVYRPRGRDDGYLPLCAECGEKESKGNELRKHYTHRGKCPGCGKSVFFTYGEHQNIPAYRFRFYCSGRCKLRVWSKKWRAKHPRPRKAKNIAPCQTCGKNFVQTRADAKACSPRCRQQAYRDRKSVTAK
jgi:hypothetical protein